MSEENKEVVRRWTDAFNQGGIEDALPFLDPEIEWTTSSAYLEAGTYHGHEGVRRFMRRATAGWEDLRLEPEGLVGAAEHVVASLRVTARARQGAAPAELTLFVAASLQGGLIVRIRNYMNRAAALEAAGIESSQTSSQEAVEVIREVWKAYTDRGIEAACDYYASECVSEDFPDLPDYATYRGREGIIDRYRHFAETWGEFVLEPVEFTDAGEGVAVAVAEIRGSGEGIGAPVDVPVAFVYDVREGKVVRDRAFTSRSRAFEAAGLTE
jgi:ketosteroid isomerase-like protein